MNLGIDPSDPPAGIIILLLNQNFFFKKPLLIDQMQILKHTKRNGISFSYKKQEDSILLAESGVLLPSKRNRTQEATEPMI